MAFVVYSDYEARRSTIHRDSCNRYANRKGNLLPSNAWLGTYPTVEDAETEARQGFRTINVRRCLVCSP